MAACETIPEPRSAKQLAQPKPRRSSARKFIPPGKRPSQPLQSQLPRSTDDAGLWRLKGGREAYAYFLRRYTTTNLTRGPDPSKSACSEVARIEKQMDTHLPQARDAPQGSVKERIRKAQAGPAVSQPEPKQAARPSCATSMRIMRDAEKRAALLFDMTPKAPVVAQPFPRFREANAAANYNSPGARRLAARHCSSSRGASNG